MKTHNLNVRDLNFHNLTKDGKPVTQFGVSTAVPGDPGSQGITGPTGQTGDTGYQGEPGTGSLPPVGTILPWAGGDNNFPSLPWHICDGSGYNHIFYTDLSNAIGTTYGNGSHYKLPDLRGRTIFGSLSDGVPAAPVGGTRSDLATSVGSVIGSDYMRPGHMPSHSHAMDHQHHVNWSADTSSEGPWPIPYGAEKDVSSPPVPTPGDPNWSTSPDYFTNSSDSANVGPWGQQDPYLPPCVIINFVINMGTS